MSSEDWTKVARFADLPDIGSPRNPARKGTKVELGKDEIFLIRDGNRVFACSNSCPHYGGPFDKGTVRGHRVTCPFHNATFNLEDGSLVTPPALDDVALYDVRVENGDVMIGAKQAPSIRMPTGVDSRSVVIVGGGAAGNAAAEALRRYGFAGTITLVTQEKDGPYDRPMLSKGYLSGTAKEAWLPLRPESFYQDLHIDLKRGTSVRAVNAKERSLSLGDGTELRGDAILLATGSAPRRPRFSGAEMNGICTLRSAADARRIRESVGKGRPVVLLGAGFIGMELASDLTEAGMSVHVVAPEAEPMAAQFGERVGRRLRSMHEERGVSMHMGLTVSRAAGSRSVQSVALSDGTSIEAALVIAAFGVTPAVSFVEGSGLVTDGALTVSASFETDAPGIFAAGDIARVPYPGNLGSHRIEHWVVAEMQGRHAARAILGDGAPYHDLPFFWTRQCEKSLKYIGFPGGFERVEFRGDPEGGPFLAGYYRGEHLVGAASLGMSDSLIELEPVIRGEERLPPESFARG